MCYGGLKLDPKKKACNSFALVNSIFNSTTIIGCLVVAAIFYYGWPIIEAIILVLPIPDPKE